MSRVDKADTAKWEEISGKCFKDQAIWALNGFWETMEKDAELVWNWTQKMAELHQDKHADGCDLDEFWSHKFLETLGETMTVIEMREKFRKIDADFNKRMSMLEYLMFRYNIEPHAMVTAPQGGDQEQINKAQAMVDSAQKAVDAMNAALADAKKAVEAAVQAENENKAALEELRAQEKAFEDKKAALEKTKNDTSIGVVKRNKAANELDQMLSEDPLPLRKAKINQAAAVKKSERATKAAEAAEAKAEAAVKNAEAKLQEALDFLQRAKASGGVAKGAIWWMEREITEKKKYLPASRR